MVRGEEEMKDLTLLQFLCLFDDEIINGAAVELACPQTPRVFFSQTLELVKVHLWKAK